ncbi:MAG: dTDP-glucose 4,6-dehydratase [Omnitrophica WOR_2 bacterium RIFCSPHIGHO2_02_FULL_48_11]|nr:MAG: dTDP-glucose 4,6-dehydratase [Omnitrophica WOR_2 bacterium RIFCSPHIGHO2_02_FULL_48_11]
MAKKLPKLLVTGGAGFIGSEFVRQAVAQGYPVSVLDKITYAGDLARLAEGKGQFAFYKADLCDEKKVAAVFKKVKPQIVVHFAAETHVDRSILDAYAATNTNVLGTQILIEASRRSQVERFIHISTDEVYGDIAQGQFHETTPLNPSSPYSAAKAAADLMIKAYVRTYRFPAVIIRPSNNYGPWQYPEKFMPVIIYKAMKNEKIPVYAQGLNVREWLYVADCARGVLTVMERGRLGEVYNIGSGNEQTNINVVNKVLEIMQKPKSLIEFVQDRPGHDLRYSLNYSKLQEELGWKPAVDFEAGVRQTIAAYKEHQDWLEEKVKYLRSYWKKVYKK